MVRNLRKFRFLALLLWVTGIAWAQTSGQSRVNANLSSTSIGLDETAILTISVEGVGGNVDVRTPTCTPSGLTFQSSGRQYSMTSINGVTQASTNFTFFVTPSAKGRYIIHEIPVDVNGLNVQTPSLRLEVTDPVGPTQSHRQPPDPWGFNSQFPMDPPEPREREDDIQVESELEPDTVYEHQVAYYTLRRLTAAVLIGEPSFRPAVPTGLITVPFPVKTDETYKDGRRFDVSELTVALFPLSAGTYKIDPWEVPIKFGMFGRTKVYQTEAKTLNVLPIPTEGKPLSFTGAVGEDFEITASVDRPSIRAGQTLDLSVNVKGDGNLDLVPYPYLPNWNGVEKHQTTGASSTEVVGDRLQSKKTYKYRIKIKEPGSYELKDITLAYFNPTEKRYETLKVPPITVTVSPGEGGKDEANEPETLTAKEKPAQGPGSENRAQTRVPETELGLAVVLSLLGLGVALFGGPVGGRGLSLWRGKGALKPVDLETLELALLAWAPAADSLTRADQLESKGFSPEQIARFEKLKSRVGAARYGASSSAAQHQFADLLKEYGELKREVKK